MSESDGQLFWEKTCKWFIIIKHYVEKLFILLLEGKSNVYKNHKNVLKCKTISKEVRLTVKIRENLTKIPHRHVTSITPRA